MAEVHIIGQVVGASNFNTKDLFCYWKVIVGSKWTFIAGDREGQTQVDLPGEDGLIVWGHPIDLHYSTSTCVGWPKIFFKVYCRDKYDRNEFIGYGVKNIPTQSGIFDIEVPCWRPTGSIWDKISEFIMGGNLQLKDESIIWSGDDRKSIRTFGVGTVHLHLNVLLRNFSKFGVQTTTEHKK